MKSSRRGVFKAMIGGTLAVPGMARAFAAEPSANPCRVPAAKAGWSTTFDGQRKADLGNGFFLNPIVAGDRPDPTILKDGADYYMTFSSFDAVPGIVIWHSRDLVNWAPIATALKTPLGQVWAMDIVKHEGRYYVYIPGSPAGQQGVFVIWADDIRGPWSDPVDLKLPGHIDPGHAVGEDGKRYLFVNGIKYVRLSDDGLATEGELRMAYEPWRYPKDWVVEMFAPEGPKIVRRGSHFYLISAVGGTSGPPTGHMVIAARSKSIHGPWKHCPHNPIVRTRSAEEKWWSRGHASLVEGPAGDWWMVSHAYENGFRTLGRQTLLEPVEWTADGWFRATARDISVPLRKPRGGQAGAALFPLSDDFTGNGFGTRWSFENPAPDEMKRVRFEGGSILLAGKGSSPANASPLTVIAGDLAYEAMATLEILEGGEGGLLLYYGDRGFVGIGFDGKQMLTFNYAQEHPWMREAAPSSKVRIKLRNDRNIVTFFYSLGGANWIQHPWQMDVSGLHHNVFGGFRSLKPAIYSTGKGAIRVSDFAYRGL
jgi:xylan 1,4-beta-xylosidase